MANFAEEVRVPLLASQDDSLKDELSELKDDFDVHYPLSHSKDEPLIAVNSERSLGGIESAQQGAEGSLLAGGRRKNKQYSGSEMIVAVFVVAFDTKKGNIVEWKYPPEVVMENIEFKSIASGLHNVTKDFIYFKQNQLYGLSCFEKIPVANQEERGARMKSVGLLAVGYSDLHLHMDFLRRQVRIQVETPGEYGSLEEYFRHYRNPQLASGISRVYSAPNQLAVEGNSSLNVIHHPVGCFTRFLQFYGPYIFVLWRLALLKKRVILFSPPPIGLVCHRVYCTCLLSSHALPLDIDTECHPQFYVNVADIDQLKSLSCYIACTTEKIFRTKTQLYDVFVDEHTFHCPSEKLQSLLRPTLFDNQRYQHLNNIRSNDMNGGSVNQKNDDLIFAEYFQELNSQLFRLLLDASSSEDHVLTVEMMEGSQLDPAKDHFFLTELASVYGLNMTVQHQRDMFSCCL